MKTKVKNIIQKDRNLYILFAMTIVVVILFAFVLGQAMFSGRNLKSMAYQIPEFGLLALGMMLAFMIGGIDLSIVSIANTSGIFAAMILTGTWFSGLNEGAAIGLAVFVALLSALCMGAFNGFLVSKLSAPPLIATLGTMIFYGGIGKAMTGGKGITGLPNAFTRFSTLELAGIPLIFVCFAAIALILGLLLSYTGFGRCLYLYGDNSVAARFSAINTEAIAFAVFLLSGLLSGLAGLIIISRVNSAKVGYGDAYQLQTMIVCVIGGIHPLGGRGKAVGVVCAIVLMQMLSSAFTIWRFSPYTIKLIWGVILILVLGLNYLSDRQAKRAMMKQKAA